MLRPYVSNSNAFAEGFGQVDDLFARRRKQQEEQQRRAMQQQAAGAMLANDPFAAEQALMQGGDAEGALRVRGGVQQQAVAEGQAFDAAAKERAAKNATGLARFIDALAQTPAEQRAARRDALLPQLSAFGVELDENTVQQFGQAPLDDASLAEARALIGAEAAKLKVVEGKFGDIYGVDERSGNVRTLFDEADRPIVTPMGILYPPGQAPGQQSAPAAGTATRDTQGRSVPAPPPAPGSPVSLRRPVEGRVSSRFGVPRPNGPHNGVDIAAPEGSPVRAPAPGRVVAAGTDARSGNFVIIEHADGSRSGVAHLRQPSPFRQGQQVPAGAAIGEVGSTGNATGPHAHLTYRDPTGKRRDPMSMYKSYIEGGEGAEYLGGAAADDQLQDVGGGWMLQPMQTPAQQQSVQKDLREEGQQAEQRGYQRQRDAVQDRRNAAADRRAEEQLRLSRASAQREAAKGNNPPPTDGQRTAAGWAYRAGTALERFDGLARAQGKPLRPTQKLEWADPVFGKASFKVRNAHDRRFVQSAKDFLAPILRKDTGAAVTDEELNTYMDIYIPRAGDDGQTLEMKAQARGDAIRALQRQAGGAMRDYPDMPGIKPRQRAGARPAPNRGGKVQPRGYRILSVE